MSENGLLLKLLLLCLIVLINVEVRLPPHPPLRLPLHQPLHMVLPRPDECAALSLHMLPMPKICVCLRVMSLKAAATTVCHATARTLRTRRSYKAL